MTGYLNMQMRRGASVWAAVVIGVLTDRQVEWMTRMQMKWAVHFFPTEWPVNAADVTRTLNEFISISFIGPTYEPESDDATWWQLVLPAPSFECVVHMSRGCPLTQIKSPRWDFVTNKGKCH